MTLAIHHDGNGYGELEPRHNGTVAVPVQFAPAAGGFSQWIEDARQLAPIAESLARTSFVPKPFQGKPAEVTAAILAGQEVGFLPMAALRSIDVIEGKPGMSAIALRALVQSHGHDIWVHESTATRAIVKGRRKGTDRIENSTWTIDRARQLGLTSKANWKNQPTNMLLARATSETARLIAADVILGMPYSTEELRDGADVEVPEGGSPETPAGEAPAARRRAQRKPLERMPSAEPEPERPVSDPPTVDEVQPVSGPPAPPAEGAGDGELETKLRQMFATFREAAPIEPDLNTREGQLGYIAQVIGREISSRKELTADDAKQITAALKRFIADNEPPAEGVLLDGGERS